MTRREQSPAEGEGNKRVLALLWHAPQKVITAGGFRRTYEIFDRTPAGVEVLALDDEPSFLLDISKENVRVIEYRIPRPVRALEARYFWYERALEWVVATVMMVWVCLRLGFARERFDVVFVPSSEQVPALLAGIFAKYALRAPLVVCNLNIDIFPRPVRKPLVLLHNFADKVIVISEHLAAQLRSYGLRAPLELNGVGLDAGAIRAVADPQEKSYEGVFVGRHDTEKGVFDLIAIWSEVVKTYPEARLAMVGSSNPTNRAKLDAMIAKLGLAERIELLGTVSDEEKYETIKRARVCVFPSYVEEWGIVPQEGLACGLPVVAYDLPVYRENIEPCEAVFREDIGDVKGMARTVSQLLTDDAYLQYSGIGPDFVSRFDWEAVASREFEIMLGWTDTSGRAARPREKEAG
jgi:glycosyltransferase involved in cell wall biosynthesis